jgi:hypothetical protein
MPRAEDAVDSDEDEEGDADEEVEEAGPVRCVTRTLPQSSVPRAIPRPPAARAVPKKYVKAVQRNADLSSSDEDEIEAVESPGPSRREVARLPRSSVPRLTPRPASPPARAAVGRPAKLAQTNTERSSSPPSSPIVRPLVQVSAGGNVFSEEETKELINSYDDIKNISEDRVIEAWVAWSFEVCTLVF